MSTDEGVSLDKARDMDEGSGDSAVGTVDQPGAHGGPNWWHRAHPVFTPLSAFFTGLLVVIIVPGTFGAVVSWLVDDDTAESLYPIVLVIFVVPLVLLALPRTRRFGRYMLFGMALTGVVVVAVGALTFWILFSNDS